MRQVSFDFPIGVPKEAYAFGARSSGETHGVVLTKPHIVDLILDLAGYTADRDLTQTSFLDPSCGHGAFVVAAVRRLLAAAQRTKASIDHLRDSIRAYDIDPDHVERTRIAVIEELRRSGSNAARAIGLANAWIVCDDFLLASIHRRFDVIAGNPPYIRIEQISARLQSEYRRRYRSLYDRADIYVAFIERALELLAPSGTLSFICADRWVLNRYGAPLRDMLASRFKVRTYIDLHNASPFESNVVAYPSIFVISPGTNDRVPVVTLETGSADEAASVILALEGRVQDLPSGVSVNLYDTWFRGNEPWVLSSPSMLRLLRTLEDQHAPITDSARVGIGVATGNDRVYIVGADADIEADRLVPLVMRDDIESGRITDGGRCVINVFSDEGGLVDLAAYPRLQRYLEQHRLEIQRRHVAQKSPRSWYRTIDRVYPELVRMPKLLIPDIAGSNEVAFDEGRFHPHHNLYFVTSDAWDMEVLGGLISSRVALFFVWSYAVKMRGGYLRFQAQYLRRIRLPAPGDLDHGLADGIRRAFRARDFAALDAVALEAYGLDELPPFDFVDTRR